MPLRLIAASGTPVDLIVVGKQNRDSRGGIVQVERANHRFEGNFPEEPVAFADLFVPGPVAGIGKLTAELKFQFS